MFNRGANNYYVVTFDLEAARLKMETDRVPETWSVFSFSTHNGKNSMKPFIIVRTPLNSALIVFL